MQREGPPSLFFVPIFPAGIDSGRGMGYDREDPPRLPFLMRPGSVADDALPDPCRLREREKRAAERKEREKT